MLGRVGAIEPAGNCRDSPTGPKCAFMRGGIDATRKAGHDSKPGGRQLLGQGLGHPSSVRRGIAPAHDGDRTARENRGIAEHLQHRRRILEQRQKRRIISLPEHQKPATQLCQKFQLALRVGDSEDPGRSRPAARAGEGRQRLDGRERRAIAANETPVGDRPHAFGAGEAQVVATVRLAG